MFMQKMIITAKALFISLSKMITYSKLSSFFTQMLFCPPFEAEEW